MPETPDLPRVEDPLAGLRAATDAHAAVVTASKQAGAEVQAAKTSTSTPAEATR